MAISRSGHALALFVASAIVAGHVEAKGRRPASPEASSPTAVPDAPAREPALSPTRAEVAAPTSVKQDSLAPASSERPPLGRFERIGASLDLFGEGSRMSGEQWINNFRADESFNYGAGSAATTLYLLSRLGAFRIGPGVRFLGNYGGNDFRFGYLTQLHAQGELPLRAFEQVDVVFGALAGMTVLFPGDDFAEEIRRLQAQGAGVWSLPRLGWIAGLSLGARRKIAGNLYGRFQLDGQVGHQWLFATDQIVDGLRFRKYWGTDIRRLGAALGIEVTF